MAPLLTLKRVNTDLDIFFLRVALYRQQPVGQSKHSEVSPDCTPANSANAGIWIAYPFCDGNENFDDFSVDGALPGPGDGSAGAVHGGGRRSAGMGTTEKMGARGLPMAKGGVVASLCRGATPG